MNFTWLEHTHFRILYECFCIIAMLLGLYFLLKKQIKKFKISAHTPDIFSILPKNQATIKQAPVVIKTGFFIDNFVTFNVLQNDFILDGYVWFTYNPSLIDIHVLNRFSFDRGQILFKSEPINKVLGDLGFVQYKIRLQFTAVFDFHLFPLDNHRLYITLSNPLMTPEEAIFMSDESSLRCASDFFLSEWSLAHKGIKTGYKLKLLDPQNVESAISFPAISYFFDFTQKGIRRSFVIILPIVLIYFVGYTTLIFFGYEDFSTSIGVSSGSFTALIAYKFVLETITPNVGYFTLADHIFNIFLAFSFVNILINIYLYLSLRFESKVLLQEIWLISILCLPFFLMSVLFYFINRHKHA